MQQLIDSVRLMYKHLHHPNRWGHSNQTGTATWLCLACGVELVPLEQFTQKGSGAVHCTKCYATEELLYQQAKEFAQLHNYEFYDLWGECIRPFTSYALAIAPPDPMSKAIEWRVIEIDV